MTGGRPRILVLFAHLAAHRSRINRALLDAVADLATVHDLLESYPDFFIDVEAEQRLLREHALIVLQHPLYWFSVPAIVKHWLDMVLTPGFAYGDDGTALHDKALLQVVTTGAAAGDFARDGLLGVSIQEVLRPMECTARFCGMRYLEPLALHGNDGLPERVVAAHARRYRERLLAWRDAAAAEA